MDITDLVFIDSTGYHFSDFPSFQSWLIGVYQGIYGNDVYLEADSQDGQFLAIVSQAFYDTAALGGSVYNSFSPKTAQGVGLSRVVKINGITRKVPTFSSVPLTIVGTSGTVINNGIAQDGLGQQWLLPATVTIPDAGTITVIATAQNVGAVFADINTITTIFTPTRGWQTVNNGTAATPGDPVETDAQLRARQTTSVADPSLTVLEGTTGGVANLAGVTKVQPYENDTDSTDGNGLPPHSICLVVAGGADADIWREIQVHKTPGTNTFGDTTTTITDSKGMALPISFQRAVAAEIHVIVTLTRNEGWSDNFQTDIQNSVAAVINALAIGSVVLLTKLYAPAYLNGTPAGQTYDISAIEIGKNATPPAASNITLDFDENPVCDPSTDITFVIT